MASDEKPTITDVKPIRLHSLMDIRNELARVYRDMRREVITTQLGVSCANCLAILSKVTAETQGQGLIERLDRLERARAADASTDSEAH